MYCNQCGNFMDDNSNVCSKCGHQPNSTTNYANGINSKNRVPKCTRCGYVGEWKKAPILRSIDFVIGLLLLLFGFIPGLIYIGVVALIRSNEDNREKICPNCKARNLWTFLY